MPLLTGRKIIVTRAREQAGELSRRLSELGATVIEFPVIQIVEPLDFAPLDQAIARLTDFDWLIFTSANGVDYFWRRLGDQSLVGIQVCAIGPATAAALQARGVTPDLVPERAVAEGILVSLGEVADKRFLIPTADLAREALSEGLVARGAKVEQVTAYRTVAAPDSLGPDSLSATDLVAQLQHQEIDLITFTSSSTVRNFVARLATATDLPITDLLSEVIIASIGPITAETARESGLVVAIEAPRFTIEGLTESIVDFYTRKLPEKR